MNDHARVADAGFLLSLGGYISSHLVSALPILQALALIATIVSGFAAAYYHVRKAGKL